MELSVSLCLLKVAPFVGIQVINFQKHLGKNTGAVFCERVRVSRGPDNLLALKRINQKQAFVRELRAAGILDTIRRVIGSRVMILHTVN